MRTKPHQVIRNVISNQSVFFINILVTFYLSPFVVESLGKDYYGIWTIINTLTGNYGLLAFGIQTALVRYITISVVNKDYPAVNSYVKTANSVLLISAVLSLLVGSVVAVNVDKIFILPKSMYQDTVTASLIVAVSVAITFVLSVYECLLLAHQEFKVRSIIGALETILRSSLIFLALKAGYGIVALAVISTSFVAVTGVVKLLIVKKKYSWLRISYLSKDKATYAALLGYGVQAFSISVATTLIFQLDNIVIGVYLPPERVAVYTFGATIITYIMSFVGAITYSVGPYSTEIYARGDAAELSTFYEKGSMILYLIGGLIASGCFLMGKSFFALWIGSGFEESAAILSVLAVAQFFAIGNRIANAIFMSMAKMKLLSVGVLLEGGLNLALSIVLVQRVGIIGVAYGTLIPLFLNNAIYIPYIARRYIGVSWAAIYKAMLPGMLICILTSIIGSEMVMFVLPTSWLMFVVNVLAITVVYLSLTLLFLALSKERKVLNLVTATLRPTAKERAFNEQDINVDL